MVKLFGKKKNRKAKPTIKGDLEKGFNMIKKYAADAPKRRTERLKKLKQQTKIAEAEAELRAAKQRNRPERPAGGGFSMGMGSPQMGLGASPMVGAAAKPKEKKKRKIKKQTVTTFY